MCRHCLFYSDFINILVIFEQPAPTLILSKVIQMMNVIVYVIIFFSVNS